jgi:cytochrome c2
MPPGIPVRISAVLDLLEPQAKVKGNRMPFGSVSQNDAADLVAYLQTYK